MGRALVPDISITDPRLLMTMPEWLNAATGLDALTHGIESFVSLAHNPLADIHALNAVGLVCGNLRTTTFGPDEAARSKMAQASLNAGLAFTNAILGATHAMSHQVGGLLDAPHGVVNGVLLPHVIRYNARETPERFVDLARAAGLPVEGDARDEAAEMLAVHVRRLADDVGVPRGLRELGVNEGEIPRLALTTLDDACLTTNPRPAPRPTSSSCSWPPCDVGTTGRTRMSPRRQRPDLATLTGVRSGKTSYYRAYVRSDERMQRAVRAMDSISRALVRTVEGPRGLLEEVARAAAAHLPPSGRCWRSPTGTSRAPGHASWPPTPTV